MDNVSLEHLNEAVDLLSSTTAVAVFYTLVLVLYCFSFRLSYTQLRDDHGKIKRQTAYTLVLTTVLLICATLDVIVSNRIAQTIYIDDSTLLDGPQTPLAEHSVVALLQLDGVMNILEELLILGVLSWRVWVIWSGTRFTVPLTIVSLFFYLINAGLGISYNVIASLNVNVDSTSPEVIPRTEEIIFILSAAFSLASSLFMTSTIIARLVFVRRKHIKLMGKSDVAGQYLGIAALLIESFALDTLWGSGSLISYGLNYAPTVNLFGNCAIQVDILTNFLVIYRVLSGRAWTRETQSRLSSLMWASNRSGATTSGTVEPRQTSILEDDTPVVGFREDV